MPQTTNDKKLYFQIHVLNYYRNCPKLQARQGSILGNTRYLYMLSSYTPGFRLNTTLFTTTHVDKQLDCLIVCDKEPCCRSINFKKISSSAIEKNCEMLHNMVYNTSEKLLERDPSFDHVYFTSSEKVRMI
jgi:hypothetical protein